MGLKDHFEKLKNKLRGGNSADSETSDILDDEPAVETPDAAVGADEVAEEEADEQDSAEEADEPAEAEEERARKDADEEQ